MNAHRSSALAIFAALVATLGLCRPSLSGILQAQGTTGKQIEVRLIPKKKSIKAGEVLEVRVEIWNVGSESLFIENTVYNMCALSPLSLRLELGPPLKPYTGMGCAGDCVYTAEDNFASRLLWRWTILPPGGFYGRVISMYPESFPQLNTPGRWRLGGTYKSIGNLSSSHCWDTAPIPDNEEQIKKLPFAAWEGKVDTNNVWIDVVRAGSSATVHKSR
ncbi:MAG: hypothetical protein WB680_21285 [Candidatus Acidiferrales bacterium]